MIILGIDNGITGAITAIQDGKIITHGNMFTIKDLSYTKNAQWVTRIDFNKLNDFLKELSEKGQILCYIERPMVNPMRFKSSVSAIRALEATLIALELNKIPYKYIDSKEWQKKLLPSGVNKEDLKQASLRVAKRLFPEIEIKNADSILIAYWAWQKEVLENGRRNTYNSKNK